MSFLEPDKYFARLSSIDIQRDLIGCGLICVLLDIDNTILTRDTHEIPRDVGVWMGNARTAGVNFCLLSNNWHKSVLQLSEQLSLPIVAKACKPLPFGYLRAAQLLGAKRSECVAIGDQLLTDVLGAHTVGMKAYLLQPLVEADLKHTLVLRYIERMMLGSRRPEPASAAKSE